MMLAVLTQLIVRIANLVEAEGALMARRVRSLAWEFILMLAVVLTLAGGVGLLAAALYQALITVLSPAATLAILGGILVLLGSSAAAMLNWRR